MNFFVLALFAACSFSAFARIEAHHVDGSVVTIEDSALALYTLPGQNGSAVLVNKITEFPKITKTKVRKIEHAIHFLRPDLPEKLLISGQEINPEILYNDNEFFKIDASVKSTLLTAYKPVSQFVKEDGTSLQIGDEVVVSLPLFSLNGDQFENELHMGVVRDLTASGHVRVTILDDDDSLYGTLDYYLPVAFISK